MGFEDAPTDFIVFLVAVFVAIIAIERWINHP